MNTAIGITDEAEIGDINGEIVRPASSVTVDFSGVDFLPLFSLV